MYQALLTRRYLTSKVMPLLASLAVVLCTAMVLIVWSVMGGFLAKLVDSGRTLVGDVVISWPTVGFPYYEDLVARLEKEPEIAGAAPVIETFGQIRFPDGHVEGVLIRGIDGKRFATVTNFESTLWWRPLETPVRKDTKQRDFRLKKLREGLSWEQIYQNGLTLSRKDAGSMVERPGVVLGIEVSGLNLREAEGFFVPYPLARRTVDGRLEYIDTFMPREGNVTLSVFPQDSQGVTLGMESRSFPVANEFHSGLFEIDHRVVLVRFDAVQKLLKMDESSRLAPDQSARPVVVTDPATGEQTFMAPVATAVEPARATTVFVRSKASTLKGEKARALAERCREVYAGFAAAHPGQVPAASSIKIMTWEDQNRTLISAVEKETGLVLSIFSFISLTAVFLVLAIFWSMVSEKTKDIGTLRAIGAGRSGVAAVWLSYGLAIGLVGSVLGGALAYTVVLNINPIHEWLGKSLGLYIWDPRVYYFSEIPSKVEPVKAVYVLAGGLLSSVLGALIPAVRAAWMDPVRALRFE